MPLYNPYRKYDQGMEDAYCGREPQQKSGQYLEGYSREIELEEEEKRLNEEKKYQKETQHP